MMNYPSDVATSQDATGVTASPDVQFTRLVGQPVGSKMSLPPVSLTSAAAHSQVLVSDVECYSEPASPTQPMEEEIELSDRESTKLEDDLDQEVREKQTYQETIRGVREWKQVLEFESST